jgi:hypothetical protein
LAQAPEREPARLWRNWAFESAALDLALRQAGRALHDVLGLEPQPVRFVNSLGLGDEPSIEHVRRACASSATRRRPDFKGHYGIEVEDPQALFHPDAPNDVAPSAYNEDDPTGDLPASPLTPRPADTGFRWA